MTGVFDLIVIGSGAAGAAAALKCANAGWKVAMVDALPYGGTCALRGCDPKKILRRGAEVIDSVRLLGGKGIDEGSIAIDWPALMAHKRGFTALMPSRVEATLTAAGVATLHAEASFTASNRLRVDGDVLSASHFLIAAGARPRPLAFPGAEHVIDSTAFLELETLPQRILFVGGGFISFEFAHIVARAGSQAIVVDRGIRPLKGFDPDLVALLVARSAAVGIDVRPENDVCGIRRTGSGFRVELDGGGRIETLDVDLVVHGAGREPDLSRLNLDAAGVAWGEQGVAVADHLQSITNPAVYAAGDAAGTRGMPLTPVAAIEGKVAASNMLKDRATVPDYTGIPTVVFTVPELARVGMLESEARAHGIDVDVRYNNTSTWYSNYRVGEPSAATKILVDRADDRVVGGHMFGPGYAEVINMIGLGMKLGLTTRQLKSMTASYPSVGSDLGYLL